MKTLVFTLIVIAAALIYFFGGFDNLKNGTSIENSVSSGEEKVSPAPVPENTNGYLNQFSNENKQPNNQTSTHVREKGGFMPPNFIGPSGPPSVVGPSGPPPGY